MDLITLVTQEIYGLTFMGPCIVNVVFQVL